MTDKLNEFGEHSRFSIWLSPNHCFVSFEIQGLASSVWSNQLTHSKKDSVYVFRSLNCHFILVQLDMKFNILCLFLENLKAKSPAKMVHFWCFFFTRWLPIAFTPTRQHRQYVHVTVRFPFFYFAPFLENGSKMFLSNVLFLTFFLTRCLPIAITPNRQVCSRYWAWIFFPANCSKFAVEWDWNIGISQSVQNLGFLNFLVGFRKKTWIFSKTDKGGKFALECVSNRISS